MRTFLVVAGLILVVPARADDVPEKYRPAVEKGLAWLVKQQHKDGHYSAAGNQYPVSMTALAGLALIAEGSKPSKGKHADAIRRAAGYLMDQSQKGTPQDGLFGKPDNPGESGRYLFGHGYAMLFLAAILDDLEPKARREAKDVLNRAVQFSARAQTSKGGWGYIAAKDAGDFDEGASSMVQIQGLRAAQAAGIPGTADILKKAVVYAEKSTTTQGGLIYSLTQGGGVGQERPALTAAAIAVGAAEANSPIVKKWHQYCAKIISPAPLRGSIDEFTYYYYSQAVYALGEEGWVKLFPQSREAERVVWSKYRTVVFDQLVQRQQADGSWSAGNVGAGPLYSTAVQLTILQLDRGHLPIQRR